MYKIHEVRDHELCFGGKDLTKLMPLREDIPEYPHKYEWEDLVAAIFFRGLPDDIELIPKENVDAIKALRHFRAVLCSFVPKHGHKTEACAYLLSEWFEAPSSWS